MPLVLLRVDERLIHGQVIVGWAGPLRIECIVVADDDLAASDWEQDLYQLGVPAGIQCEFLPLGTARERVAAWQGDSQRVALLVRGVAELARLAEGGSLANQQVNLGGIHHAPGRERVLAYLFLSADERAELARVAATGAQVWARDLPDAQRFPLAELLTAAK